MSTYQSNVERGFSMEQVRQLWIETWGTNLTEQNWWSSPAGIKRWKRFVARLNELQGVSKAGAIVAEQKNLYEWLQSQRVTLDEHQMFAVTSFIVMNYLPVAVEAAAAPAEAEKRQCGWTEREEEVIADLMKKQELSRHAVLRQGLRLFQMHVEGALKLPPLAAREDK